MLNPPETVIRHYIIDTLPEFVEKAGGEFAGPSLGHSSGESFYINSTTGLWIDFKNEESGNFQQLVAYLEGCTIQEANRRFLQSITSKDIKGVFVDTQKKINKRYKPVDFFDELNLAPITEKSVDEDPRMFKAKEFLRSKKLVETLTKDFPMYLCIEGAYANTVIIPFIRDGKMIFFQARTLSNNKKFKYLTPSSDKYGIKSSNILYPYKIGEKVYVTEGPLKARILQFQGINATSTQGANLSMPQAKQLVLNCPEIVLAYDADIAGAKGMQKAYITLVKKLGFQNDNLHISPIPVEGCNDWDDVWSDCPESINKREELKYTAWSILGGLRHNL